MRKPVLIGAGALARDLIDCVGAATFSAIYVDPQYARAPLCGLPVSTSWDEVCRLTGHYVLGISDIAHRERAITEATARGLRPAPPLVAPTAVLAADAVLADGACVGHVSVLGPGAVVGTNALVMHGVVVGHDSQLGANSVLCAGVSLAGFVTIGMRCFIGANAMLAPGVRFGDDVYAAAAAACFRDAEAGSRWIGNPARRSKIGGG